MSRAAHRAADETARATHYSYTLYADPEMASRFDAARFGGPIGELLARTQADTLLRFAAVAPGETVLDVGTGTGRAALVLASAGAAVTGADASEQMLQVARERAAARSLDVTFVPGDVHDLPFEDGAFDVVVCLRVLMHTPDWRRAIGELCRVARRAVILDYPARTSAACLESVARRVVAHFGARVEAYRVFSDRAVGRELANHGFAVRRTHRQFVLPIAVHKRVGSPAFTRSVERGLASVGLLRLLGSPVTLLAERCASS